VKDTKIHCRVPDCYWNIGVAEKDNCACGVVDISHDHVCHTYVTKEEAKRRIKAAVER